MAAKMGFGRFFAETWVGSKPSFQPSDCMNASVDSSYLSGYHIPIAAIFPLCPNIRSSILLHNSSVDDGVDWSSPYYPYSGEATAQLNSNYSNSSYDGSPKEMEHAHVIARLRQQYGNVSYSVGYGSQCTNASTLVSPWAFREKVAGFMVKSKGHFQKLQQRSRAWYGGQDSALIAAWWEMYRRKKKLIKKGPNF